MLSNLLYCQGKVSVSGSTSDLEAEWKKLYPASLLTARWILCDNIIHKQIIIIERYAIYSHSSSLIQNDNRKCRNLKSRLTVYQRTHAERSAPRQPMQVFMS